MSVSAEVSESVVAKSVAAALSGGTGGGGGAVNAEDVQVVLTYVAVSSFELTGAAAANVDLKKIEAAVAAKAGVPVSGVTAAVVVSPGATARRLSQVAAAVTTTTTVTTMTKAKDYAAASALMTVLSSAGAAADVGSSLGPGLTASVGSTAGGVNLQVAAVVVVPEGELGAVKAAADGSDAMKTSVATAFKEEGVTVLVTAAGKAEDAPAPAPPPPLPPTNTTEEEDGFGFVADESSSARSRVAAPLALIISSAVITVLAAL